MTGAWFAAQLEAMYAEQPLVTRDHIDFGRVWSAACRG
ncbi:Short peptide possibly related to sulfur metabolism [Kitasatospora purpeofusca]